MRIVRAALVALVGCGPIAPSSAEMPTKPAPPGASANGASGAGRATATATARASATAVDPASAAPPPARSSASSSPDGASTAAAAEVFAKLRGDLTACYDQGRKAVPSMTSGKLTLHASVDVSGRTVCVVPSDDTGITQDVENCMRTRLDAETYAKSSAPWSFALPLVVRDAVLSLGEAKSSPPAIETVESHGVAEDVYDVVDALLPDLYACFRGVDKSSTLRVVTVGARVGRDGRVECALASSASAIPEDVRACTVRVFSRAKFQPPKRGYGLVSLPLNLLSRR